MFKLIITSIVCLFTSLAVAQTTLFGSDTTATNSNTSNPGHKTGRLKPADVMSPDEFESRVKSLGQQNRAQLDQQVTSTLKPPVQQQMNMSPTTPNSNQMNQTPSYNTGAPQPTQMQAPASSMQNNNAAPARQQSQSIDQSAQGYTGFQGTGSSGTSNQQSGSSGGWNVKY